MARHRRAPARYGQIDLVGGALFAAVMIGGGAVYALLGTGVIDGAAWGFTDGSTGTGGRSLGPQLDAPPWVSGVLGTAMAAAGAVVAWGAAHEARARAGGAAARPVSERARSVAALGLALFVGVVFALIGGVMTLAGLGVIRAVSGGSAESPLMASVGAFVAVAALMVTLSSAYRWKSAR